MHIVIDKGTDNAKPHDLLIIYPKDYQNHQHNPLSPVRVSLAYFLFTVLLIAVVLIKLFVFTILPGISSDGINLLEKYVNKVNIFILFLISVDNFLSRQYAMS